MAAFSFSICSRACTPAWERARIRWRSTKPMRVAARAAGVACCAPAGVHAHQRTDSAASRVSAAMMPLRRPIIPLSSWLERATHRELDIADLLFPRGGRIEAIVYPDRTEGGVPPDARTHRVLEIGQVDGRAYALVRAVHVAHVEEQGGAQVEGQGHGVLEVAQDLEVAADLRTRAVHRRDLAGLEAPDGVRPAHEVALEERHRIGGPADLVSGGETPAEQMIEPERMVLGVRDGDTDEAVITGADAREVDSKDGEIPAGSIGQAVARVTGDGAAQHGQDGLALGIEELGARVRGDTGHVLLAQAIGGAPARVVPEGSPEAEVTSDGALGVVLIDPTVAEEIEAGGERTIEEPGIGDADGPLLDGPTAADPDGHLEASPEEVVLGKVHRADGAVLGAVAAAHGEEAGGLLRDVDVDDDLVLGRARSGLDVDLLEVVQVGQLLLGPLELLRREEIAFGHGNFAPEDLLLAARVARDVDPLHEDLGAFRDLQRDVDLAVGHVEGDLGIDVGGGPPDGAVDIRDGLGAVLELGARVNVAGFEHNAPSQLLRGEDLVAGDVDTT